MQHFRIEPGTTVEMHSHPHEQITFVLEGEVTFLGEDGELAAEAGDSVVVPGGETHGAANRSDQPVAAVEAFHPRAANVV